MVFVYLTHISTKFDVLFKRVTSLSMERAINLSSTHQGLSLNEVVTRRAAGQANNAKLETSRSYWQIFRENIFTFINVVFLQLA